MTYIVFFVQINFSIKLFIQYFGQKPKPIETNLFRTNSSFTDQ